MKYDHDIIRDLMPLCIDGIASEKSRETVEKHIAECSDCKNEWEQMKKSITPCENIPLPEDTSKYKDTAKRVRKKYKWMILRIFCFTVLLLLITDISLSYLDGARFTTHQAARRSIEQFHNLSQADLKFIGTVKHSDKKGTSTYVLMNRPDEPTRLYECYAERYLINLGMWYDMGIDYCDIITDEKIYMTNNGVGHFDKKTSGFKYYGTVAFYVTDDRIKNINFMMYGQSYTLSPDKNGFCGMAYEPTQEQWDSKGYGIHEGTATDENGKVLYEIQQKTKTTPKGSEFNYYDWVNVE